MFVLINGENIMTKCHHGIVTCVEQATKFSVLCIWCVSHQIDVVINNTVALLQDGQWIKVVYKWCMHLRCQEKFIMDMNGEMCPKKMNWWVHFNGTFNFYILCRRQIIEHTYTHVHFKSPSTKWWTTTLAIMLTIGKINKTIV